MTASCITFEHVWKRYGKTVAVRDLSMALEPGTLTTLLGPSGCGKTTTLRMIAGLEMASEGCIRIDARDVTRESPAERDVSMVFQSYALFPHMTVLDNVAYGLVVSGRSKTAARERAMQTLALVKLGEYAARHPSELSGGQQQRVAIARALVLEPKVLLFDEPLSNLDTRLRRTMRDEIRDLQRRLGLTVVYVTHDQSEALAISDRVVVMRNGEILQSGTPQQLYEHPRDAFVAGFMGECNIVPAQLLEVEGDCARVDLGGLQLRVAHADVPPGPVRLSLRPEGVRLSTHLNGGLLATIKNITYLGGSSEITLETPLGEWLAIQMGPTPHLARGQTVNVDIEPRCAVVLPGHESIFSTPTQTEAQP